jgi:alpha/beta superfamily hydrolase
MGQEELVRLRAWDGGEVVGDLTVAADAWAGAVVCHPHPAYGGDRRNIVVERIYRTLAAAGVTVLRFDFRQDDGADERQDVLAAVERIAGADGPLVLVGYSFGADIALSVDDPRVAGWAAVAPPLRFGPTPRPAAGDERPVLVLAAEHDQFNPPASLRAATADWLSATVVDLPGADHFLAGSADSAADAVLGWLRGLA